MLEVRFTRRKSKKGIREFSKKALTAMILLWFVGAVFGFFTVGVQLFRADTTVGLAEVLTYIGAPMTGGILGYMLKSAAENREKIKSSQQQEEMYEHV